ncbi:MAG TPA: hypothetical protein VND19_06340 [Acetobacteraceae bacterium]|nr:hypothetical protein [Acetobacteraceae bacterium]
MSEIGRIGLDTSKAVLTLHGVEQAGQPVLRVNLRRARMIRLFRKRAPTVVAISANASPSSRRAASAAISQEHDDYARRPCPACPGGSAGR